MSRIVTIIIATVAMAVWMGFIIGLSHSISTGFAGFYGGLPFMIIAIFVMGLALYDFWDEGIRGHGTQVSRDDENGNGSNGK